MRFTYQQIADTWWKVRDAAESLQSARVWLVFDRNAHLAESEISDAIDKLRQAAAALGYSFEPLPVTDAPGFDGRDDSTIGHKLSAVE